MPHGANAPPLHGEAAIGLAVGAVINQRNIAKHFDLTITASRLDGIYVIRTSVSTDVMSETEAVSAYKRASPAWNGHSGPLKSVDLAIRPVHHWLSPQVRAHVFLFMMAY